MMTGACCKPIQITPHFYQLGTLFFPVYLSVGEEAMLIEGGIDATAGLIMEQIKFLGIAPQRITTIALTHMHSDHIGAVATLKKAWPHLKVLAHPMARKLVSDPNTFEECRQLNSEISEILMSQGLLEELHVPAESFDFDIDIDAEEGQKIHLGNGVIWTVHYCSGHAPCQMAFMEESEETVVIGDSTGLYSPEKDVFWPNPFVGIDIYCNSIRKLADLSAKRVALSHNGVVEGDARGFFQKALKTTGDYHNEMLERVAEGEDPKKIAAEKGSWVSSLAGQMPLYLPPVLAGLLIKCSLKQQKIGDLSFDL